VSANITTEQLALAGAAHLFAAIDAALDGLPLLLRAAGKYDAADHALAAQERIHAAYRLVRDASPMAEKNLEEAAAEPAF